MTQRLDLSWSVSSKASVFSAGCKNWILCELGQSGWGRRSLCVLTLGVRRLLCPPSSEGRMTDVTHGCLAEPGWSGCTQSWDQHGHGRPGPGARYDLSRESGRIISVSPPAGRLQAGLAGSSRPISPVAGPTAGGRLPWTSFTSAGGRLECSYYRHCLWFSVEALGSLQCAWRNGRKGEVRIPPQHYLQGELSCHFQVTKGYTFFTYWMEF